MKLRENYNLKTKNIIFTIIMACAIIVGGVGVQAASKHTTKPSLTINAGQNNPLKHDSATCTISYCTRHKHTKNDQGLGVFASKVQVTLYVKSSAKNTKKVSTTYESLGISGLAYCDWNNGSKTLSLQTAEADKYKVKAKYTTRDCFCDACVANGEKDYDAYSNIDSGWKSE